MFHMNSVPTQCAKLAVEMTKEIRVLGLKSSRKGRVGKVNCILCIVNSSNWIQ